MVKGKIAIRKINCSKSRQVTFFKRRTGLMKKAKELSILCDAEIGVIIFSCTGKLYDYASTSMKSVIERYNKMKQENQQQPLIATEIQFLQKEAESLKQQLKCLQECNRRLMGKELSKLSLEDLKQLENILEMGLKNIRSRKDQSFMEEMRELKRKVDDVEQENVELRKKLRVKSGDYIEFKGEFSAETSWSKEMSQMSAQAIPDKDDIPERILLQLSLQPKPYLLDAQKIASG
ncbi:MADS-box transcription factor 23-like isoform X1 [Rhodamnia argentea]|uniref:MADS-box transcription factor 23-like isoform X1 n=1 Tax=Rhodamnia argentea TaxID=178133 RepID=A0A8B8PWT2_9MYRT|nr:MADS-box transcription factor 23-like isoform X1 [Rhodamnia argentea]XP_030539245.1 MADS-box transcription factor 23-like isoform X1 [Rhodamnia argentea]